jgi:hypothetical protein
MKFLTKEDMDAEEFNDRKNDYKNLAKAID